MLNGDEVAGNFSFTQFLYYYWGPPPMNPPPVVHNEVGKSSAGVAASHAILRGADGKAHERRESTSAVDAAEHVPAVIKSHDGHSTETERVKKMACCEKTE